MLIVDDNAIDYTVLQNIFQDTFIIEQAKSGNEALIRLRHYGKAISVILLDLMMPGMDGFAVLEKIQSDAGLQCIPVIIVSGDESHAACLTAIRKGATDFITKPVDADLLRIRVNSAVSKAENERLRAINSLLEVKNEERAILETALIDSGVAVIEYDWLADTFSYSLSISKYLLGTYDNRNLWLILLSDMVTDMSTVQILQGLVHQMIENKEDVTVSRMVKMKTPKNVLHNFKVNINRMANEFQFMNKLIITMHDLDHVRHTV